jgi:hypothetical protein
LLGAKSDPILFDYYASVFERSKNAFEIVAFTAIETEASRVARACTHKPTAKC